MDDKIVGSDFRERGSIFKQMGEMKKKIQLVEGERKAIFEDCENEKRENKDKIKKLKEEIKGLQNELRESSSSSEPILRHVQERKFLDMNVLKRKSGDDAVETMDYKVADLRKQLDKLRFLTKGKNSKIDSLMKEYEKVVTQNAEIEKAEEIMEDSEEGQRLRFLENEIHKTNLKLMEGETIRKKYNAILDMLKKERLTFGNQLESLESTLRKQDDEIEKLKVRTFKYILTPDTLDCIGDASSGPCDARHGEAEPAQEGNRASLRGQRQRKETHRIQKNGRRSQKLFRVDGTSHVRFKDFRQGE